MLEQKRQAVLLRILGHLVLRPGNMNWGLSEEDALDTRKLLEGDSQSARLHEELVNIFLAAAGGERLRSKLEDMPSGGHLQPSELQFLTRAHRLVSLGIQCEDSDYNTTRALSPAAVSEFEPDEKVRRMASPERQRRQDKPLLVGGKTRGRSEVTSPRAFDGPKKSGAVRFANPSAAQRNRMVRGRGRPR